MVYEGESCGRSITEDPPSHGDDAQHPHDTVRAQHHCSHPVISAPCHHSELALKVPLGLLHYEVPGLLHREDIRV